jgi:ABC-2 type transport system permease protein
LQVEHPFEWKWYFAFQQVGDETTAPLTEAYLTGRKARDRWAARLAWFAPPVLMERTLSSLAATDLTAALSYEQQVRAYHRQLRQFYYPKLFTAQPYTPEAVAQRPEFVPLVKH